MNPRLKRVLVLVLKLAVSVGIYALILKKIYGREDIDALWTHLSELSWGWVLVGAVSLCCAIGCSVVRWHLLLVGQGIRAPARHLIGSFMIGRFFGAVTPGGFVGLNGYRIYDIAKHTGKTARSVASIGIEMVLGQLAMGVVAFFACFFGYRYVGVELGLLLQLAFAGLVGITLTILWRPVLVRRLAQVLPAAFQQRLSSMVDAVCAYEGRGKLLLVGALLGVGTHSFNSMIYVCSARALHVDLLPQEVFFVSTMQIIATLVPLSINGVGLREAMALQLYTSVGISAIVGGILIPNVGFVFVEMGISAIGGLWLLARSSDYAPHIEVAEPEREDTLAKQIELAPRSEWPVVGRGAAVGLAAGIFGGLIIGLGEAWAVVGTAGGSVERDVWFYGALFYAGLFGALGSAFGALLAFSGRLMQRAAFPEPVAFSHMAAGLVGGLAFVLGIFRIRRDVYHEELVLKSGEGLMVLGGCLLAALVLYAVLFFALRALAAGVPVLLRPAGSLAVAAVVVVVTFGVSLTEAASASRTAAHEGAAAGPNASNILFIVVDTLRADHLPAYGYEGGRTPHLDAFARDAVRFDAAYANASWTRPSFASLLSGRFASSHGVMSKAASLPDSITTLPEALSAAGYATHGVVTNYNVAPFFNFQQGFDRYAYLAPDFVLGAGDSAAKLLLLQVLRKGIERVRAMRGRTEPGSAYHDAETVNRALFGFLESPPQKPWFMFAGYMDPHDPYFTHPYDGYGYGRAAHPNPPEDFVDRLRALYDGEIHYWDEHFGALIAKLKAQGLYDDMTIVVTSDHGEEFMEHGAYWHGTTLYDEQLAVPLFVKLPHGEQGGTALRHWVQSVDIMPTLLSRAGIKAPEGVQGGDLFRGSDETFAEESHEGNVLRSVRTARYGSTLKLIEANPGNPRGLETHELYRMDSDPGEHENLADRDAGALAEVQKKLETAAERAATGAATSVDVDLSMDQAAQERLKALGYAGDE